jgi:hypothetical protein
VWPSFSPIDAEAAEAAARRTHRRKVDPEPVEKTGARCRDFRGFITDQHVIVRSEKICYVHAEATGKVEVANAGCAKFFCLTRQWPIPRSIFKSDADDPVGHLYHCRRCKPEILMPPIPVDREQARLCELGEMGARSRRRDPGRKGKLVGGQGTAIEAPKAS